jgi:hypothetical protein
MKEDNKPPNNKEIECRIYLAVGENSLVRIQHSLFLVVSRVNSSPSWLNLGLHFYTWLYECEIETD